MRSLTALRSAALNASTEGALASPAGAATGAAATACFASIPLPFARWPFSFAECSAEAPFRLRLGGAATFRSAGGETVTRAEALLLIATGVRTVAGAAPDRMTGDGAICFEGAGTDFGTTEAGTGAGAAG